MTVPARAGYVVLGEDNRDEGLCLHLAPHGSGKFTTTSEHQSRHI